MPRSGTASGTVVRWDEAAGGGVVESPELTGGCWVAASAVEPAPGAILRAGQVVTLQWTEPGAAGHPFRAVRVTPRDTLQASPGA